MKKLFTFAVFIAVSFYSAWTVAAYFGAREPIIDPADSPPRKIEISLGMSVKELIERNGLNIGERAPNEYNLNIDLIRDVSPLFFDDNWIELYVFEEGQNFVLPPGRTLFISQIAGKIRNFSLRPFKQPRPLAEMNAYMQELVDSFLKNGWTPQTPIHLPVTENDFPISPNFIVGQLKSKQGNILNLTLTDYGSAAKQESYILAPIGRSSQPSNTYLLTVGLYSHELPSYSDLIYPRRIYENNGKDQTLRVWVDDPDWTPEKAGMIPVPEEERKTPESSQWKMPPK